jgi:hypothetical protein
VGFARSAPKISKYVKSSSSSFLFAKKNLLLQLGLQYCTVLYLAWTDEIGISQTTGLEDKLQCPADTLQQNLHTTPTNELRLLGEGLEGTNGAVSMK